VKFLRERRGEAEAARQSSRYTAKDRSRAIDVLRGVVVIVAHPYEADPFSGAGNCWCGRDERSRLHHVVVDPSGDTTGGDE
jgi:hypothetical protein